MSYQTLQSYRLSRNLGEILRVAQNSVFKNHPRDILQDENHLYGIVPVHIIHKTALNTTKRLQVTGYRILKIAKTWNFRLTA